MLVTFIYCYYSIHWIISLISFLVAGCHRIWWNKYFSLFPCISNCPVPCIQSLLNDYRNGGTCSPATVELLLKEECISYAWNNRKEVHSAIMQLVGMCKHWNLEWPNTVKIWKFQYLYAVGAIWWYLDLYYSDFQNIWYFLICK